MWLTFDEVSKHLANPTCRKYRTLREKKSKQQNLSV
jgi:hypothetical protein